MSGKRQSLTTNKRLQVGLLALLFFFPMVVAYVLFYVDFRPSSGSNYGQLVQPVKPIKDAPMQTLDGQVFRFSDLREKWTMLYVGHSNCDEVCENNLYKIQQVRLAQGKNIGRVNSVYIVPAAMPQSEAEKVGDLYPGILILLAQEDVLSNLVDQLYSGTETALQDSDRVYIVDPIGNVMMMYPAKADPSGIKKDLTRLLKVSQVG